MKILFAGYRDWSHRVIDAVEFGCKNIELSIVNTQEQLLSTLTKKSFDLVFLIAWSWIVPNDLCEKHMILGIHPSDLPRYAGGTPIQHQIIDGQEESKVTLFRITHKLDAGAIYAQNSFSLKGHMSDVFNELERSSSEVLVDFIKAWPEVNPRPQSGHEKPLKGFKPKDSFLSREQLKTMTAIELYNFMRCKEDPYPNACVEDETGTLFFESVRFEKK